MGELENQYGHFSADGREYIITRPATPMPWVNVISNGDYGLVLSQAGSGYSWRAHASLNRLTRWEQDLIRDEWGKYLYLRDAESGEFWSPTWQPCGRDLENYQARHGWGYSTIAAARGRLDSARLESALSIFVPLEAPCEVWLLHLANRGEQPRRLQIFSYLEWLLGAAPDWHREFHRVFIDTRYDERLKALLATKVLWELPGESGPHWNRSWPYLAFHSVSAEPAGFEGDKRAFLGRHGSPVRPQALVEGRSSGTQGRWGEAIASLRVDLELAPGEETEIAFTLGMADDEEGAREVIERFRDPAEARRGLEAVQQYWTSILGGLEIETPDPALNRMANGWLAYQAISGRLYGRSAYYQTGGAFGFRDQLQDSLVWHLLGRPEQALAQIRLHAAHQYQDGIVLHWWHPLAETGLRSEYSDDLLWLPFAVLVYLDETGDFSALEEEIPFFDGGAAPLQEHCLRSFKVALGRRSERGLPLILKGDWNDGLNAAGANGRGESIWMAHFLYYLLTRWAALPDLPEETVTRYKTEAEALRQAANTYGWDGAWYWRATTDSGRVLGSAQNEQGRIFLNAQTWSVLSGLAPAGRAAQAMASAREHLYQPYGALLLDPAYSRPDPEVGYLTSYAPGRRENGGVYVHAACWAVLAERKLNGADAAYRLWRSFCPAVRGQEPDRYAAEPYVMPGNVDGPGTPTPGQAGWSWYTGSAAWYLRALVEGVLGVRAEGGRLCVKAKLPEGWQEFRVTRRFRGAVYHLHLRRGGASEEAGCSVDGGPWTSEELPLFPAGTEHQVEIIV
jgi:cellobiose phosphorylase